MCLGFEVRVRARVMVTMTVRVRGRVGGRVATGWVRVRLMVRVRVAWGKRGSRAPRVRVRVRDQANESFLAEIATRR